MASVLVHSTNTVTATRKAHSEQVLRTARKRLTEANRHIDRIMYAADSARHNKAVKEHEEKCPESGVCELHGWNSDW
jgi:hypothetical protein